jgi:hypothetical protein
MKRDYAALILYVLGVSAIIYFAILGQWERVAVAAVLVLSLWSVTMWRAVRAEYERDKYEREIADPDSKLPARPLDRRRARRGLPPRRGGCRRP